MSPPWSEESQESSHARAERIWRVMSSTPAGSRGRMVLAWLGRQRGTAARVASAFAQSSKEALVTGKVESWRISVSRISRTSGSGSMS